MPESLEMWRPYRLSSEIRAKIDSVAPIIKECEAEALADRRFPMRGIDAMWDAGLFNLALAKEVGGEECDPVLEMEIYEAIARISVTACWNLLIGNIHTSWATAYLSDEAVAEIFPKGHRSIVAGQAAPMGKATAVEGGYRITGQWSWGSGISHSNWVMGGFISPEGEPRVLVTPKSSIKVLDNWHVIGVEGSGSYDYAAEDLFVPHGFTYSFVEPQPKRGGPRFTLPWYAQASVPHTAVSLGGAQHALEAIALLAASKRRGPAPAPVAERGAFQRDLGEAYVRLNAMRDCAARLFEHMIKRHASSNPLSEAEIAEVHAMGAQANRTAVDIANMAFRYAGGDSVRLTSPIQRILRDVLVAQQHLAINDTGLDALGVGILKKLGAL